MIYDLATIFYLLAHPPADLIYHLVVSMAVLIAGGFAWVHFKGSSDDLNARQILRSCIYLLAFQIVLFLLRVLFQSYGGSITVIYPLVERLLASLTILVLLWMFFSSQKARSSTRLGVIIVLFLSSFAITSFIILNFFPDSILANPNYHNLFWQVTPLILILTGFIAAFHDTLSQRTVFILMLTILAAGHILQILYWGGMFAPLGAVRAAQTLTLPWVLVLVQRLSSPESKNVDRILTSYENSPEIRQDIKPLLMDLLLQINLTQTDQEKIQSIVKALSFAAVADICYLIKIPEGIGKLEIMAGYDLIRETIQKPDTISREDLPLIMDAWNKHQPLILRQDLKTTRDSTTLGMLIKYQSIGHCLAYPLNFEGQSLLGGVIFLSPYTGKKWAGQTLQMMDQVKDTLTQVLFLPNPLQKANHALSQAHVKLDLLSDEIVKLRRTHSEVEAQLREKETTIKGLKAKYQIEKMATIKQFDGMNKHIIDLSTQVSHQKNIGNQVKKLQVEVRQLTSEREKLSLELSRSKALIKDLQIQTGQTGPIRLSLLNQIVSLDSIVANVKMQVSPQLHGRQLDLEIQNPDGRQMIKTDTELMQTVLFELLTNAIQASQPRGTIQLVQKLSYEMGMLNIHVTDYGEGLTSTEQNDFFSAQFETIPGIGNVMSIRNAIRAIRVLNGKIWLKSKKTSYTTFRCEIPVRIVD